MVVKRWLRRLPLVAAAAILAAPTGSAAGSQWAAAPSAHDPARAARVAGSGPAVVITAEVRQAFDSLFRASNLHWDELAEETQLAQMLGTGKPTQLEYMGCLRGRAAGDTVWVNATTPARGMIRFQFAVTGSCDHVRDLVGTWHTHPFRAALDGHAIKERHLSSTDLRTFSRGSDRAVLAVWDVDSIDVAVRMINGAVRHPSTLVVRPPPVP